MAKGLPWVGRGGPPPVARDQFAPPPGGYLKPSAPVGQASTSSEHHESLDKDWPRSAYSKPRLMR